MSAVRENGPVSHTHVSHTQTYPNKKKYIGMRKSTD